MNVRDVIAVEQLAHCYGSRQALCGINLRVGAGQLYAVLGPNGGGKTTLFRVLTTLIPPQSGTVTIGGYSAVSEFAAIRRMIGVVFQSPSLDKKLTVDENLQQQGCLYGLYGKQLHNRRDEVLERLGVIDRRNDLVETLSGGLQRRVDLAKALMHHPTILLMDEPTTGLDPGARIDLWHYFDQLRRDENTTLVVTTHLLEEAERADQLAILDEGNVIAQGTPSELRARVNGTSVIIETNDARQLCERLNHGWNLGARIVGNDVRFSGAEDADWTARLMQEFPNDVTSVKVSRPTLEDVFVEVTGHQFWQSDALADTRRSKGPRRRQPANIRSGQS